MGIGWQQTCLNKVHERANSYNTENRIDCWNPSRPWRRDRFVISDRLYKDQRKAAGWALVGMGVLTTVPIVAGIFGKGPLAHKRIGLAA